MSTVKSILLSLAVAIALYGSAAQQNTPMAQTVAGQQPTAPLGVVTTVPVNNAPTTLPNQQITTTMASGNMPTTTMAGGDMNPTTLPPNVAAAVQPLISGREKWCPFDPIANPSSEVRIVAVNVTGNATDDGKLNAVADLFMFVKYQNGTRATIVRSANVTDRDFSIASLVLTLRSFGVVLADQFAGVNWMRNPSMSSAALPRILSPGEFGFNTTAFENDINSAVGCASVSVDIFVSPAGQQQGGQQQGGQQQQPQGQLGSTTEAPLMGQTTQAPGVLQTTQAAGNIQTTVPAELQTTQAPGVVAATTTTAPSGRRRQLLALRR